MTCACAWDIPYLVRFVCNEQMGDCHVFLCPELLLMLLFTPDEEWGHALMLENGSLRGHEDIIKVNMLTMAYVAMLH